VYALPTLDRILVPWPPRLVPRPFGTVLSYQLRLV
jgi:hypothetical protein